MDGGTFWSVLADCSEPALDFGVSLADFLSFRDRDSFIGPRILYILVKLNQVPSGALAKYSIQS